MLTVHKTNDSDMGTANMPPAEQLTKDEIVDFLNAAPNNAVVLVGSDAKIAVFRGASYKPDNFYIQELPLEEPDADGGDFTASEAVSEAIESL